MDVAGCCPGPAGCRKCTAIRPSSGPRSVTRTSAPADVVTASTLRMSWPRRGAAAAEAGRTSSSTRNASGEDGAEPPRRPSSIRCGAVKAALALLLEQLLHAHLLRAPGHVRAAVPAPARRRGGGPGLATSPHGEAVSASGSCRGPPHGCAPDTAPSGPTGLRFCSGGAPARDGGPDRALDAGAARAQPDCPRANSQSTRGGRRPGWRRTTEVRVTTPQARGGRRGGSDREAGRRPVAALPCWRPRSAEKPALEGELLALEHHGRPADPAAAQAVPSPLRSRPQDDLRRAQRESSRRSAGAPS